MIAPIKLTGWVVGLTRPASHIDGPMTAKFERDLAILGAVFVLSFGVMMLFADRLSRPLSALADSATALARGEPFAPDPCQRPRRPPTPGGDDVDEPGNYRSRNEADE